MSTRAGAAARIAALKLARDKDAAAAYRSRMRRMGEPIDYSNPRCICRLGGMGRRADCDLHGLAGGDA